MKSKKRREAKERKKALLDAIGKLVRDYQEAGDGIVGVASATFDDETGVAVEFEDEELEENDLDEVPESDDSDGEDDGQETDQADAIQPGETEEELNEGLTVQDIDAYWLQRKISQAYWDTDPEVSRKNAEEVLKYLAEGESDVENMLVMLLDYDKLDLVKFLVRNRLKIVWCTRLARAEDDDAKKKIEKEMSDGGPALSAILAQLHTTRATANEG